MAFTTFTGGRSSPVTRFFDGAVGALRSRRAYLAVYRQTHRELSALSDRELADLGFTRCDIGHLSHEAADRALHRR